MNASDSACGPGRAPAAAVFLSGNMLHNGTQSAIRQRRIYSRIHFYHPGAGFHRKSSRSRPDWYLSRSQRRATGVQVIAHFHGRLACLPGGGRRRRPERCFSPGSSASGMSALPSRPETLPYNLTPSVRFCSFSAVRQQY
ncbi:hypothetical protein KCP69_26655 (plasmid) [Salmonella enterica subsp. enterica]|nr:hypothetical protein KCP69_26655 [Salmonella enterica subsp. enterica]